MIAIILFGLSMIITLVYLGRMSAYVRGDVASPDKVGIILFVLVAVVWTTLFGLIHLKVL